VVLAKCENFDENEALFKDFENKKTRKKRKKLPPPPLLIFRKCYAKPTYILFWTKAKELLFDMY